MSGFLIAVTLTVLFVAGSVFALQPSPRQRQIARLRQAAVGAGLRVRLRPAEVTVDYILPWRLVDLEGARTTDFVATRDGDAWTAVVRAGPGRETLLGALAPMPVGIEQVSGGADGLVARWAERGEASDVAAIAAVLAAVREACTRTQ